jgi:hypothetical protein
VFPTLPPKGAPGNAGKSSVAILKFAPVEPADPNALAIDVPIAKREKEFTLAAMLF